MRTNTLFDGAFGTYYAAAANDGRPCESANLENPAAVLSIHREYIAAGATAIKTNTFAADSRDVLAAGWRLANEAAGGGADVFADIGGATGEGAAARYASIAETFLALGAKRFLFETLDAFEPVAPALDLLASRGAAAYVTFAVSAEGFTRAGLFYRSLIARAMAHPAVSAAGLNCGCGPAHMLALVKRLGPLPKPLAYLPNAGYAAREGGRAAYRDNTDYFAARLADMRAAGAAILGGCCGTTPAHIAKAAAALQSTAAPRAPRHERRAASHGAAAKLPPKPVLVELDPPADGDVSFILSAAAKLKAAGASAITLADSPLGKARADSVLTAAKVKAETGVDVIPHIACRDKNRIAIQAALLGAGMFGIDKVLCVTGDPVYNPQGRRESVFDFNSAELIAFIAGLNEAVFSQRPFQIGAALNVNAVNFEAELERCRKKALAGASFVLSQPIFTEAAAANLERARAALDCALYAGVLPVAGYKNAVFLNNEVSGIEIPPHVIERLRTAAPEAAAEVSSAFAAETVRRVYDAADGFYIMTPLKRVSLVAGLMDMCFA